MPKPIQINRTDSWLLGQQKTINTLAQDSNNIILTYHAEDRMEERDIDFLDVIDVLRSGKIDKYEVEQNGNKFTVRGGSRQRDIGVVTVILKKTELKVITAMWVDPK